MSVIISGSMAYDNIMVFQDRFKNHILPDKVHMLNVSFLAPTLRREFGGCAGNIAYNLALLEEKGVRPLATVGNDFAAYQAWFEKWGVDQSSLLELPESYTAQAYIITDLDDNQITAFHPGAMNSAHLVDVPTEEPVQMGLVSPNGREAMLKHARQFALAGIPFLFDPGQGLPLFSGEELLEFFSLARWAAMNDYELHVIMERTGLSKKELAEKVDALIVTRGSEGSRIYTGGRLIEIPTVAPMALKDPTGCGDAYRAGLIYGICHNLDWETTGRIGALLGSLKIACCGTQNHYLPLVKLHSKFQQAFGVAFPTN